MFCIPKILKNESNSQLYLHRKSFFIGCFVSQRYWKMKAIHNLFGLCSTALEVVLYPKDTEKWKQFTTKMKQTILTAGLFCIPKILKNESNSQQLAKGYNQNNCCFVSQRYWKMKAIHNFFDKCRKIGIVVLYPKDTEKWKQFTTQWEHIGNSKTLFCIPKILKNESNSQQRRRN